MYGNRFTARLAAGIACTAALTTGCGADQLAAEGAEQAVEEAIEQGAGGEVEIDADGEDGAFKMETSAGSFQAGSNELPEDFPSDAVPMVEGDIRSSSRISDSGVSRWTVAMTAGVDPEGAFTAAHDQLVAAGFEEVQSTDTSGFRNAVLEDADYRVALSAFVGTDDATLNYGVSELATQ